MEILEQKDICGHLPYELHCLNCDDMIEMIDFCNVGKLMRGIELQNEAEDDEWAASQQYKPILRPLSDLYKPTTHNGKEIIPIVECTKIAFPNISGFEYNTSEQICYLEGTHFGILQFRYENGFLASLIDSESQYWKVENQYQLFDFLHELKIDYRGLIDAGLAIDCNTLENNPY
jgi:hypothetical protein